MSAFGSHFKVRLSYFAFVVLHALPNRHNTLTLLPVLNSELSAYSL